MVAQLLSSKFCKGYLTVLPLLPHFMGYHYVHFGAEKTGARSGKLSDSPSHNTRRVREIEGRFVGLQRSIRLWLRE